MRFGRPLQRLVSWIACFAILMGAFAPAISQVLQSGSGTTWAEVCTSLGAKLVQVDAPASDPATQLPGGHLLDHCPYCSLHATALGLPPTPVAVPLLTSLRFGLPERFLTAPATPFAWTAAQPRAPPLSA